MQKFKGRWLGPFPKYHQRQIPNLSKMNKKTISTIAVFYLAITLAILSCSSPTSDNEEARSISISGKVVDAQDQPIENAIVRILNPSPGKTTTTDADGLYNFDLTVDSSQTYVIEARKEGFPTKTEEVLAIPDRDIEMPDFILAKGTGDGGNDGGGGTPSEDSKGSAFISLDNVSEKEIRVNGAGGVETTDLTFAVTDSAGTPVSDNSAVYVNFEILEGPQGGESIYPDSALTINGKATATLKSGTISGVVQVQASFTRQESSKSIAKTVGVADEGTKATSDPFTHEGTTSGPTSSLNKSSASPSTPTTQETITHSSTPIQITIHGGLPSSDHFTMKSEVRNIPLTLGEETPILVDLGDQYGNDVPVGTMVHFKTEPNMGTITGSAETDENGIARATLQTGDVAGISTITAETINDNSQTISKQIDVLFSGTPSITINPENVSLEGFTKQTFDFTVADQNNNPLAQGTSISVTVDNDTLALNGDTDVSLSDVVQSGNGSTDFKITLSNPTAAIITDNANLKITVDGPNGSTSKSLLLGAAESPSTNAGSIMLESVSNKKIGVINTGQTEQSQLTFHVTDSTGASLDANNTVDVNFRLGNAPGGGEELAPKTATTDANGRVSTTLTSGTVSGIVQVIAETTVNGTTLSSKPIAVAIEAGLPVQNNFTFKTTDGTQNMVAESGAKTELIIYAGDKFGNPVPEGTPISLTTDRGIVTANTTTDGNGEATATFTASGSTGMATITAETSDMNEQAVTKDVQIMLSGSSQITGLPANPIDLTNFSNQTINYTVADGSGNPLTAGTNVTVSVDNPALSISGDTDVILPEAIQSSQGTTDFSFDLTNTSDEQIYEGGTITVSVNGSNGTARETVDMIAPNTPSINPGHITLAGNGITSKEIGVINTGQTEQTQLTFQVTDSTGRPLNLDNQTEVTFSLGSSPGGGENVFPKTVTTNGDGQATTTLTSGTEAGVTQVLAQITTVDGTTITSQPVQVAIHAGLPDPNHFTLLSEKNNVTANSAEKVRLTAYAGDKHGNVVPEGTTIYFTTEGGYITGSAETNAEGEATATLTAVNPTPGDGISTVTAETVDDTNSKITATTDIIFSGNPIISISPSTFTISDGGKQDFTYTVMDSNNHPMPTGTTIEVSVIGGDFEVTDPDDGNITLGSNGRTDFGFTVADTDPGNVTNDTMYITVTVTLPNGDVFQERINGVKAKIK